MDKIFERGYWSDKLIENVNNTTIVEHGAYSELMNLAEDIQNRLDVEKEHSKYLQDELTELQSEDIRNALPDGPIDVVSMLVSAGKYDTDDLEEMAQHLQACVKNSWKYKGVLQ